MPVVQLAELFQRGQYAAVIRLFDQLRESPPWENAADAGVAYYYAAMSRYRLNQAIAAVPLIARALDEIHTTADWVWIGRLRYQAGEIYRRAGHTGDALHWTQLFLADTDRYPEHETYRGPAHYQLGLILRQRRDIAGSIDQYEQAVEILRGTDRAVWLVMALQNLAWLLVEDKQLPRAVECMERVERALHDLDDSREAQEVRLTTLYARAFVRLHQNRPAEGARLCEEVLIDGSGATVEQRALATWVAAECGIALQQWAEARTLVEVAVRLAIEAGDSRIMNYVTGTRCKLTEAGDCPA